MAKSDVSNAPVRYNTVLCIGTGVSGIALAAKFQQSYGKIIGQDIHFYEKNEQIGGTWWANSYPGCACDIPSAIYSFSFDPHVESSRFLPTQPETLKYVQRVAKKYGVFEKTSFRTLVQKAEWRNETQLWRLYLKDLNTGGNYEHECKVLFGATGPLSIPRDGGFKGREQFGGIVMHSAEWDNTVELAGKNVIVVGNGCTGTQMVPALLQRDVASVRQFFRSKHWVEEAIVINPFPAALIWSFKYIPGLYAFWRLFVFLFLEQTLVYFYENPLGRLYRQYKQSRALAYIKKMAPKEYHEMLIPDFDFACKRRIIEPPNYLKSLHSPRVSLHNTLIESYTPTGIRTIDGQEFPADVVALATGFISNEYMFNIETIGEKGETLKEHWSKIGGNSSYNGCAMSGFPNFFNVLGPNSAAGHMSVLLAAECNIDYALRITRPVLTGVASSVTVKPEAERRFVAKVQEALKYRVWSQSCGAWYDRGGWNGTLWPWTSMYFWWRSVVIHWADLDIKYKPSKHNSTFVGVLSMIVVLGSALWLTMAKGYTKFIRP